MEMKYFDIIANMFLCWVLVQLHLSLEKYLMNLNPKAETNIKVKWKY